MHTVNVLYGHPTDPEAFDTYYRDTHIPIAARIPDLRRFEVARVAATPDGSALPYYRAATLYFDDANSAQTAMSSAEGRAAVADLRNFATGGVTVFMAQTDEVGL